MSIYFKHPTIPGNVTAAGYADQIAITNFSFGCDRNVTMETGNIANRCTATANLGRIILTKQPDKASALLFEEAAAGDVSSTVTISFCRTTTEAIEEYLTFELTKCILSGYNITGDAGDSPASETIVLSYTKIDMCYTDFTATDAIGGPAHGIYNIETGTK